MAPREGGHEPQEDLSWRGGQTRRGTEPSLQLPRGRGVRLKRNPSQSPLVPDELRAALAAGKGSGRLGPPPKNTLHSARASWLAGQRKVLAAGTTRQPHSAQWESGLGPTLTCPSPASALGAPQRDARSRRGGSAPCSQPQLLSPPSIPVPLHWAPQLPMGHLHTFPLTDIGCDYKVTAIRTLSTRAHFSYSREPRDICHYKERPHGDVDRRQMPPEGM